MLLTNFVLFQAITSLIAQLVKNPPAMQETTVWFLGWLEDLTHWKRPFPNWERLKAGGEGDDRGWDGWMASLTQWTWVWVSSGSWWWTGNPGVLQSMVAELDTTEQLSWLTETIIIFSNNLSNSFFLLSHYRTSVTHMLEELIYPTTWMLCVLFSDTVFFISNIYTFLYNAHLFDEVSCMFINIVCLHH